MNINCIAIDDEPLALEKIANFIEKIDFLNLVGTFNSALDGLQFLKNNKVDLMFLDVQMDDLTGIQMLESMGKKPYVILITAYDHYALKSYELDVADYLLKPVPFKRFVKSVEKIYQKMMDKQPQETEIQITNQQSSDEQNIVFLKSGNKIERINLDEILYIEGMKDYLRINMPNKRIMILQTFKKIETYLAPKKFKRVHKSYIIAIDKIECIETKRLIVAGQSIPIGESYRKDFFDLLKERQIL